MPVLSQAILAGQRAQLSAQTPLWIASMPQNGGLLVSSGDANFSAIYPGTQDFCWEMWLHLDSWQNQPSLIAAWGSGGNLQGVTESNLALTVSPNVDGNNGVAFQATVMGTYSTDISILPAATGFNAWVHVALCRIGSTVNVYANGALAAQITGVTANLDAATVGGDGFWMFTGPTGDRDQSWSWPIAGAFRNVRYTIGNNVYGNVSSFTPPSLLTDIAPVTGTQYIWWPAYDSALGIPNYTPDYEGSTTWSWTSQNGSGASFRIQNILSAYPAYTNYTPYVGATLSGTKGTWTNNGTAPNQPKITTTGITPLYGNSCGNFTATGTDVRISSADSTLADWSQAVLLYIWFYVPATITNERKTIIAVETTNGAVLHIGRAGQGLDWVSVSATGGAELAYGPHIWARNAWNFLCVQKFWEGSVGPISAWAGANGDNYAVNLNLVDAGGSTFTFASGGNVSIGCTTGSNVSCQMYFNQILGFYSGYSGTTASQYSPSQATIPIMTIPAGNYASESICFDFQGTNGNTSIQPVYPV